MIRTALSALLGGVLVALAAGIAAFGLLVVFQPFAAAPASVSVADPAARETLRQQIESVRSDLRATEISLTNVKLEPSAAPASADNELRLRTEAQIAAATERQDLALRHAEAIRAGLAARADVTSLAEIRDSAVIGQLLAQRTAIDLQIAEQGARLRRNHPTMLALSAQRAALTTQVNAEAAHIASALETEAQLEASQLVLLQSQLPSPAASSATPALVLADTSTLETRRASQEARLEALMDAYFGVPGPTAAEPRRADPLGRTNLAVVAIAALVAFLAQLVWAWRSSRRRHAVDLAHWQADADPEAAESPASGAPPIEPELRRAS